jgi:hypothetical protein
MAWRSALALCCFGAICTTLWGDESLRYGVIRLPSPEQPVATPGDTVDTKRRATLSGYNEPIVSGGDYRVDDGVVPSAFFESRRAAYDLPSTDTPIAVFPGHQYVDRRMDEWFTNVYSVGCGLLGIDAVARGYYVMDQRIQWSGVETTFAAEGALTARYERRYGDVGVAVGSDFFFTQPFDRNMLDDPERRSYFGNYDYDTFEISQLYLEMQRGAFAVRVGKMITPFGRYYYPVDTNLQFDAPFIRTESIRRRETGVLFRYLGDVFTGDLALTNGCDDRDTNSSKALVARVGYDVKPFAAGISVKRQDGIGSEEQKQYNSHVGADAAWQRGRWTISGEVLYDEYGFSREFDPDSIFWGRSIYYRDVHRSDDTEITGLGWYVDCLYHGERWLLEANYGQFHPDTIGVPQHDQINHRGIVRVAYDITESLQVYNVLMIENRFADAQLGRTRRPWLEMVGLQYLF